MRLFETFFLSLMTSLFAGAFLFLGIPLAWHFVNSDKQHLFYYPQMFGVLLLLYVIYVAIQLLLSVINLVQVIYLKNTIGLNFNKSHIIRHFLVAELILYLIVFLVIVALFDVPEIVPAALLFSIPYIICCTNSIFLFRYFLKRVLNL
jgi:hypothetical protein